MWNAVFDHAEDVCGVPRGSIRGTVLIETLPAVFQMHEILYELREHSAGLNCGRWDYIFSFIKTVRAHPDRLLPDRVQVPNFRFHLLDHYTHKVIVVRMLQPLILVDKVLKSSSCLSGWYDSTLLEELHGAVDSNLPQARRTRHGRHGK